MDMDEQTQQQHLLTTHRNRLAVLVKQQSQLGSAHTPPGTITDIAAARAEIRRIKAYLRAQGVEVADLPDDDAPPPSEIAPGAEAASGAGDHVGGDKIEAGNITNSQGVVIGRGASAHVDNRSGFFIGHTRITLAVLGGSYYSSCSSGRLWPARTSMGSPAFSSRVA